MFSFFNKLLVVFPFQEYACGEYETFTLSSGMVIHYVDLGIAEWRVRQEPDIAAAMKLNSDLIPHVYEGTKSVDLILLFCKLHFNITLGLLQCIICILYCVFLCFYCVQGHDFSVQNILGGLKLWECALDLTEYISSLDIAFRGLKVLEVRGFDIACRFKVNI